LEFNENDVIQGDMEKTIKTNELAEKLQIKPPTVRKYCQELEKSGYSFMKDDTGARVFRIKDENVLFQLIRLREQGVSLESAADAVAIRNHDENAPVSAIQDVRPSVIRNLGSAIEAQTRYIEEKLGEFAENTRELKKQNEDLQDLINKQSEEFLNQISDLKATLNDLLKSQQEEKSKKKRFLGLF
jgi:DNA-binding transcriptional MerR regulator